MVWIRPIIKHGEPTAWNWWVWYPENFTLGNNVDIGSGTNIFCHEKIIIEDNVKVGGCCLIYTYNSIDETRGPVILKKGCKIGAHTIILPNVEIGENSIVGAHSLVKENIKSNVMAMGIPAKKKRRINNERSCSCSFEPEVRRQMQNGMRCPFCLRTYYAKEHINDV